MFVILADGILESGFVLVKRLCPLRLVFGTENPAGYVLGFHNEHAIARHVNVIDLGGAATVRQGHVVESVVFLCGQASARFIRYQ